MRPQAQHTASPSAAATCSKKAQTHFCAIDDVHILTDALAEKKQKVSMIIAFSGYALAREMKPLCPLVVPTTYNPSSAKILLGGATTPHRS